MRNSTICLLISFLLTAPVLSFSQETEKKLDKPLVSVDQAPVFPGGEKGLLEFIGKNLRYPRVAAEAGIQGRVTVRFLVDNTGKIDEAIVIRELSKECDNEAIRLVRKMPTWEPGKQNNVPISTYYTLPIVFKLKNKKSGLCEPILLVNGLQRPYSLLKDTTQLKPRNIKSIDFLKESAAIERFGDRGVNGAVLVTLIKGVSKKDSILYLPNAAGIYNYGTTELYPVFPGDENALHKFIVSNLKYPKASAESNIEGRTVLRFVIGKTGAVEEVSVIRSLSLDCDMEAARVIKMMPTWTPAMMKGEPVPVYYTLPMVYKLVR